MGGVTSCSLRTRRVPEVSVRLYPAKEMMNMNMVKGSGLQFLALEKETGVNLDNYYKLRIGNTLSAVPVVSTKGMSLDTEPVVDEAASFGGRLARDMKQLRGDSRQIYD